MSESVCVCPSVHACLRDIERGMRDKGWANGEGVVGGWEREGGGATGRGRTERERKGATEEKDRRQ